MRQSTMNLFSLEGKTVLITGCASGIGREIAIGVAGAGATVVCLDVADLTATAEGIQKSGSKGMFLNVDVSDSEAIDAAWDQIVKEMGSIDVLFNNAGIQYRAPIEEFPIEKFDSIMAVNFKSAFLLSKKVSSHFMQQGIKGKIINTTSLYSTFGGYHVTAYTSAKHALLGLTRALSNELSPHGICVNAITPGYITTAVTQALWSDESKSEEILKRIPIGRWGTPEDLVGSAIYLASRASDYVTGVAIPIDGGFTAR